MGQKRKHNSKEKTRAKCGDEEIKTSGNDKTDSLNTDKKADKEFISKNIICNYQNLEKSIVEQLKIYNIRHGGATGVLREDIWLELFQLIVPKKFVIEHSVFIIDAKENLSKEVDIAIVDQAYTPYIFQYGRLKYIPIEAVAAVVECKSKRADKKTMKNWIDAIKALRTSSNSVVRLATGMIIDGSQVNAEIKPGAIPPLPGNQPDAEDNQPEAQAAAAEDNQSQGDSLPVTQKPDEGKKREPKFDMQTSTRPIRIFCGYNTSLSSKDREFIEENFDFVLTAKWNKKSREEDGGKEKGAGGSSGNEARNDSDHETGNEKDNESGNESGHESGHESENKIQVYVNKHTYPSLLEWYLTLNHYENLDKVMERYNDRGHAAGEEKKTVSFQGLEKIDIDSYRVNYRDEEISLLSFNFMLNQLLMLINNPMFFPHRAYVTLFNNIVCREDEERGKHT